MKKSNFRKTLIVLGYALTAVAIVLALIGLAQIDYRNFEYLLVVKNNRDTIGTIKMYESLVSLNLWKAIPLLKASGIVAFIALVDFGGVRISSWFEKE